VSQAVKLSSFLFLRVQLMVVDVPSRKGGASLFFNERRPGFGKRTKKCVILNFASWNLLDVSVCHSTISAE
jgi:hypothetical protein